MPGVGADQLQHTAERALIQLSVSALLISVFCHLLFAQLAQADFFVDLASLCSKSACACASPVSTPSSSTRMWSACCTPAARWETMNTVMPFGLLFDGLAQGSVGGKVQRRGTVVQNQNLRLRHQRAGNRQALALAAGEVAACSLHGRIQHAGLACAQSPPPGQFPVPAKFPRRWHRGQPSACYRGWYR